MDLAEISVVGTAALLAVILGGRLFLERRRRRHGLLVALHHETRGLCLEAANLAEALCLQQAEGWPIDPFFVQRWGLSAPQTYPGLVSDLWRLPPHLITRLVDIHAMLTIARRRWSAWNAGAQDEAGSYLLLSALVRSANDADYFLRHAERLLGWPKGQAPTTPLANVRLERFEQDHPEQLDVGYWSL